MKSFFGLSDIYKNNVAKILRGTTNQLGCSVRNLKFENEPKVSKEEHIAAFLKMINSYFSGIMRFEEVNGRVIPIVYNKYLLDAQNPAFSNDAIAMGYLILLLYTENKNPVPQEDLIQLLMVLKKSKKDVTGPLKELKENYLISESNKGGYITYEPTNVLYAILPLEILQEIRAEIEEIDTYKDILSILEEEYQRKQKMVRKQSESASVGENLQDDQVIETAGKNEQDDQKFDAKDPQENNLEGGNENV